MATDGSSSGGAAGGSGGAAAVEGKAPASLLDAFWSLAAVDGATRLAAVGALTTALVRAQSDFEDAITAKQGTLPGRGGAPPPPCNDVRYAAMRLTRGVCSSNGAARQGFALALCEALQRVPAMTSLEVLSQLMKATQMPKRGSREEQRDALLGRVFGLLALARAGRLPGLVGVLVDADELDPGYRHAVAAVRPAGAASAAPAAAAARRPAGGTAGDSDGEASGDEDGEDGTAVASAGAAAAAAAADAPREDRHALPALIMAVRSLLAVGAKKAWLADIAYEAAGAVISAAGAAAWSAELAGPVSAHLGGDARAWSAAQLTLALVLEEVVPAWLPGAEMAWPPAIAALRAALSASNLQRYRIGAADDEEVDAMAQAQLAEEAAGSQAAAEGAAAGTSSANGGGSDSGSDSGSDAGSAAAAEDEDKLLPPSAAPLAAALLSSTHSYPQIHSVWGHLLQRYVATGVFPASAAAGAAGRPSLMDTPPSPAVLDFVEMWRLYVDELLLSAGPERKAAAMALLASVLPQAAGAHPAVMAGVLSPMLVGSLVRNAASKKRLLHSPALFALEGVRTACAGNSDAASAALVALLARGHPDFDRRTHTTTVAHLLAQLDDAAIARHVAAAAREFVKPSTAPVYADIASTATGLTGVLRGADAASVATGGGAPRAGEEEEEEEERDELYEDDASRARRLAMLSPPERRRLWALDTLTSAARDPALGVLHSEHEVTHLLALLALHAVADVSIPETLAEQLASGSLDAALAAAASGKDEGKGGAKGGAAASGKKRSRSDAERPQLAALVRLHRITAGDAVVPTGATILGLVADPPFSTDMREEVRHRVLALTRTLAALLSAPPLTRDAGAAPVRGPTPVGPPAAWLGTRDRQASLAVAVERLTRVIHSTWQAAADAAAALPVSEDGGAAGGAGEAVVVTLTPSAATLATPWAEMSAGDDGSDSGSEASSAATEDDGEGGEEASGAEAPPAATLRQQALAVCTALRGGAAALVAANNALHAAAPPPPPAGGASAMLPAVRALAGLLLDGGRALGAFAQLHTVAAAAMLLDAANPSSAVAETGIALSDLLRCTPALLRDMLAPLRAALAAAAAPPAAAQVPPTPGKRGKAAAAAAAATAAAAPLPPAVAAAASQLAALYDTLTAASGGAPADASVAEVEVFTDACLALAANSSLLLRDAIKAAARFAFAVITPDCVSTILGVVVERKVPAAAGEGSDEEGAESDDDASEAEAEGGKRAAATKGAKAARKAAPAEEEEEEEAEEGDSEGEESSDDGEAEEGEEVDSGDDDAAEGEGEGEEGEEVEDEKDGEMTRYDSMLGAMIRARKDSKAAAKQAKLRETEFKFRALELLDVAITRLAHGPAGCAHSAMLALPLPLLDAVGVLSRRAAPKVETPATLMAADEAAKLLTRVMALLTAVTKSRLLVVRPGAPAAAPPTAAIPADDVLTLFDSVIESASEAVAPTRAYGEACSLVTTFVLRSLHVRSAAATTPTPAAAAAADAALGNSQPGAEYVEHLAGGYASIAKKYLSEKHTHVNANLFRGVLAQVPVVAVRLLPTLAGLVAGGSITKAFKLVEACTFMATIVKAATAVWALPMPCAVGEDRKAAVTVADYLAGAMPPVLAAITSVLRACTVATGGAGAADAARVPLNAKQLREPLSLLAAIFQRHLVRPDGAGSGAALDAAAAFLGSTAGGVAVAARSALAAAGRDLPPRPEGASGDSGDGKSSKQRRKEKKAAKRAAKAGAAAAAASDDEGEGESAKPKKEDKGKGKGKGKGGDKKGDGAGGGGEKHKHSKVARDAKGSTSAAPPAGGAPPAAAPAAAAAAKTGGKDKHAAKKARVAE